MACGLTVLIEVSFENLSEKAVFCDAPIKTRNQKSLQGDPRNHCYSGVVGCVFVFLGMRKQECEG